MKRILFNRRTLGLVAAAAFLVACGSTHPKVALKPSPSPSASPSPSPLPSPSPTVANPPLPPAQAGPLPGQGLPLSGPIPDALLIQVENTAPARPQAGLGAASVVFQYLTEGDITRMSALYHQVPGVVGPVRSVRFASIAIFQRMGAVQMASGGSQPVLDRLFATHINSFISGLDHDGTHFFRWSGRVAPHNLYTSQAQMLNASQHGGQPPKSDDIPRSTTWAGTTPVGHIDVPADRLSFNYANGTYDVVSDGSEETDVIYGVLRPHSVAILHVRQWVTNYCPVGHGCLRDYDLLSGGAAEFYANGTEIAGRWTPGSNARDPLGFVDGSGATLAMPPGLMWVVLAP